MIELFEATRNGDVETLKHLIDSNNHLINEKEEGGWGILHISASAGNFVLCKLLIEKYGLKPNAKTDGGQTALHYAASKGHYNIVCLLLENGAVPCSDKYGFSPIHRAVCLGRIDIVKAILEKFPETLNRPNDEGDTPLHMAVQEGHNSIARYLLESGAEQLPNTEGKLPKDYGSTLFD
jgi:26S proteasome non-ATPase regulatory subunit 10